MDFRRTSGGHSILHLASVPHPKAARGSKLPGALCLFHHKPPGGKKIAAVAATKNICFVSYPKIGGNKDTKNGEECQDEKRLCFISYRCFNRADWRGCCMLHGISRGPATSYSYRSVSFYPVISFDEREA